MRQKKSIKNENSLFFVYILNMKGKLIDKEFKFRSEKYFLQNFPGIENNFQTTKELCKKITKNAWYFPRKKNAFTMEAREKRLYQSKPLSLQTKPAGPHFSAFLTEFEINYLWKKNYFRNYKVQNVSCAQWRETEIHTLDFHALGILLSCRG